MKPIKLIMSAFGPYAQTAEVDFTRFGEKGIFLIPVTLDLPEGIIQKTPLNISIKFREIVE